MALLLAISSLMIVIDSVAIFIYAIILYLAKNRNCIYFFIMFRGSLFGKTYSNNITYCVPFLCFKYISTIQFAAFIYKNKRINKLKAFINEINRLPIMNRKSIKTKHFNSLPNFVIAQFLMNTYTQLNKQFLSSSKKYFVPCCNVDTNAKNIIFIATNSPIGTYTMNDLAKFTLKKRM